jgi:hypothetical protein
VNGLPENDLIDRKGHDVPFGVAARTGVGDLVEKLEDMAPCTLPEKFAMSGVINTVMDSWCATGVFM